MVAQQVTVFGANGRVGRLVVAELVNRGYNVVAVVHSENSFIETPQLQVVTADVYDPKGVDRALEGADAVISTLGSWGTPKKDILSRGMANIIPAMKRRGITRIVSLTGADARAPHDKLGVVHKLTYPVLMRAIGKILVDGERHVALLAESDLDWTVLRSPVMIKRQPKHDNYTLSMKRPLPWHTVPYRLVAYAMVDVMQGPTWIQQAPYVSWRPW